MIKRPAVFFDRDNTLIISDGYLGDPAKVVLVEGAADAIAKARQYGFRVLTFSNQSGVARGLFDESAVQAVNKRLDELLALHNPGAVIERHEYCPDHPEAEIEQYRKDTPRRKPGPGMLLEVAEKMGLDLARSWVVGDAPRDIEAGKAAGCRTILFKAAGLKASPAADAPTNVTPDFVVDSLKEAVELIGRESFRRPVQPNRPAPAPVQKPLEPVATPESQVPEEPEVPPAPPVVEEPKRVEAEVEDETPQNLPPGRRVESLLLEISRELKRQRHESQTEFSVMRLLAVIAEVVSAGVLFLAWLYRSDAAVTPLLLTAIALQAMVISLLMLARGK